VRRIYFANHTSNLDAPVLWAALPEPVRERCRPVAAHDYWTRTPLHRFLAEEVFRAVLIERCKPTPRNNPVTRMLEAMGTNQSLILFPEGGRFPGPEPGPFKSGLYHLARRRPEIECVPVLLSGVDRILPKGALLPAPAQATVTFGEPLRLHPGEHRDAFLYRARQSILRLQRAG
jgi:1-acyl-sn-glycerol-3-phosphate acyltransferase